MNTQYEPTSLRTGLRDMIGFTLFALATRIISPEGKAFLKDAITEKVQA